MTNPAFFTDEPDKTVSSASYMDGPVNSDNDSFDNILFEMLLYLFNKYIFTFK